MAKAKAKSKSSKVAEKVEILKAPPKPKVLSDAEKIELVESGLSNEDKVILSQTSGSTLAEKREDIVRLQSLRGANLSSILNEIDKY